MKNTDDLKEKIANIDITFSVFIAAVAIYAITVMVTTILFPIVVTGMFWKVLFKSKKNEVIDEENDVQFSTRTYSSGGVRREGPDI